MQPTNQNDDQPQSVLIEPYRGPLTARLNPDRIARLASVRVVARASSYNITPLVPTWRDEPRGRETLRRIWRGMSYHDDPALVSAKQSILWLLCGAVTPIALYFSLSLTTYFSSWSWISNVLALPLFIVTTPTVFTGLIMLIKSISRLRRSQHRSMSVAYIIVALALYICLGFLIAKDFDLIMT
jgi:hypothetical protein